MKLKLYNFSDTIAWSVEYLNYKRKVKGSKLCISRSLQKHQLVKQAILQTLFKRTLRFQNFVYSYLLFLIKVDLFFSRCCYYFEYAIIIFWD